jgi:hypothetical protein
MRAEARFLHTLEGGDRFKLRAWNDPGSSPGQGLEPAAASGASRESIVSTRPKCRFGCELAGFYDAQELHELITDLG